MFTESLLENSWAHRTQRSWTTLTSFGLQTVVIGLLLLIPLLTTIGLPAARTVSTPITMGRRDPGPAPHTTRTEAVQIVPYTGRILLPTHIPTTIPRGGDLASAEPAVSPIGDIGIPIGSGPSFPIPISGTRPVPAVAVKPPIHLVRTSSMLQGSLIRRVEPVYPPIARNARIQGPVILEAVISEAGTIENLQLISGHPMLVPAAIDAVRQWRYRPYILNDEAIEVETQITVNFVLGGS